MQARGPIRYGITAPPTHTHEAICCHAHHRLETSGPANYTVHCQGATTIHLGIHAISCQYAALGNCRRGDNVGTGSAQERAGLRYIPEPHAHTSGMTTKWGHGLWYVAFTEVLSCKSMVDRNSEMLAMCVQSKDAS